MDITVKQAKSVPAFMITLCSIGIAGMLISIGFSANEIAKAYSNNQTSDATAFGILIGGALFVIAFAVCAIADVCVTLAETYTFTSDKLIKKYKDKIKFEIPYSEIDSLEIDKLFIIKGWAMSIHSTKPFVKYGTNKFLKRVGGYFKKDDLYKIKEKIAAYNAENGESIKIIEKINFFD